MFKEKCCGVSQKCRVFELVHSANYQRVLMKIFICSKCNHQVAVIERMNWNGECDFIRKCGKSAEVLYNKNRLNIIAECFPYSPQNKYQGFYLNYSDKGVVKKCYSNFSSIRIGEFDNNLDDLKTYFDKNKDVPKFKKE